MTTNPCPHTPTHWPLNMIACGTTSELRQTILDDIKTGFRHTKDGLVLARPGDIADMVEELLAAQRQQWEAETTQILDRLTTKATETKDVKTGAIRQTVGLGYILNERRNLATLDGELGKQQGHLGTIYGVKILPEDEQ